MLIISTLILLFYFCCWVQHQMLTLLYVLPCFILIAINILLTSFLILESLHCYLLLLESWSHFRAENTVFVIYISNINFYQLNFGNYYHVVKGKPVLLKTLLTSNVWVVHMNQFPNSLQTLSVLQFNWILTLSADCRG